MTPDEMRNVGFPWSPQLVGRTFSSAGGTIAVSGRGVYANMLCTLHCCLRFGDTRSLSRLNFLTLL